jgi:UDP-N-acetylglucosamine:LPS N-acetylglucosamine transferase
MTHIELVYFDAGGGHRSAAIALQEIIARKGLPWRVELTNLQELLDPIDIARRLAGVRVEDVYNTMLRKGWTLGSPQLMRVLQMAIHAFHGPSVRLLEKYWRERQPELVVSFVPHFNRALCESLAKALPGRPFVTILTDFADYPPHFWIERQKQFLICGSERAVCQARQMGHSEERIFRTSGMILNPRFYQYDRIDRDAERRKVGLEPSLPTGLVLFGGQGSSKMIEIERRLDESAAAVQLILICGKNGALEQTLRARRARFPRLVEGFTTNIPYYMQLADFFIGKPGPGSITEALAMGLPVIVERNAWTLPQERYNTDWVREKQVGLVVHKFSTIAQAVAELLQPENFDRFRHNAAATENHALFEIPEILQTILDRSANSGRQPIPGVLDSPASEAHV